jgi:hypothetical protein
MLAGVDSNTPPCLLLDPITARRFIDRGGFEKKADLRRPRSAASRKRRCSKPHRTNRCAYRKSVSVDDWR